jgi:hypothetical protein
MDVIIPDRNDPASLHSLKHYIETVNCMLVGSLIREGFYEMLFIWALRRDAIG